MIFPLLPRGHSDVTRKCKGTNFNQYETRNEEELADESLTFSPPTTLSRCGGSVRPHWVAHMINQPATRFLVKLWPVSQYLTLRFLPSFPASLTLNPRSCFPGIMSSSKTLAPGLCLKFCFVGDWANTRGLDVEYNKLHLFISQTFKKHSL